MAECTLIFKKICHELSLTVAVSTQDCSSSSARGPTRPREAYEISKSRDFVY